MLCLLQEFVNLPFVAIIRVQFPEKEGTDRIAAHNGVEKLHDLFRLPDEFSLNGREEILPVRAFDCRSDGLRSIAHGWNCLVMSGSRAGCHGYSIGTTSRSLFNPPAYCRGCQDSGQGLHSWHGFFPAWIASSRVLYLTRFFSEIFAADLQSGRWKTCDRADAT